VCQCPRNTLRLNLHTELHGRTNTRSAGKQHTERHTRF